MPTRRKVRDQKSVAGGLAVWRVERLATYDDAGVDVREGVVVRARSIGSGRERNTKGGNGKSYWTFF